MKMNDPDQVQSDPTSDDYIEIVDLDMPQAHASDVKDGATQSSVERPPLPFLRQRRVQVAATSTILLAALVVLLSVSGAFSWLAAQVHSGVAVQPLPTRAGGFYTPLPSPQQDGLACLVDASWSPDSKQVAVLGYGLNCPLTPGQPSSLQVNIYTAAPHKLIRQVQLDTMISSAFERHASQPLGNSYVNLGSIAWSPTGQELAVSFNTDMAGLVYDGILLLAPNGHEQRVMLWQDNRGNSSSSYLEWDLVRGAPRAIYFSKPFASPTQPVSIVNLQPAPAYRWGANGTLEPASQPANAPIGNPNGASAFTVWQPGAAELMTQQPPDGPTLAVKFLTWNTHFTAWSPDGRYFIDQVYTIGRFVVPHQPSPSHQELDSLGMDQLATLAIRDKALARLLAALLASGQGDSFIAWRPDGRELAMYNGRINIYDCATGRELASLLPPNKPVGLDGGETFSWSPDGSHLMLSSPVWGVLTMWEPGQLPR